MVWGWMFWDGPGYACKIDRRKDGDLYVQIMEKDLKASMDYYGKSPQDVVFQQDNDPKHTCKKENVGSKAMIWRSCTGQHNLL